MKLFGHSAIPPLFAGLFDDAALFPPASLTMPEAARQHGVHKHAWYSGAVGRFVCSADRLAELDEAAQHTRFADVNLALTVPGGIAALDSVRRAVAEFGWVHLKSIEVAVAVHDLADAIGIAADAVPHNTQVFIEITPADLTMDVASALKASGLGLKLRTGGTGADAFPAADVLTEALGIACGSGVRFKLTAGLHHALPYVDQGTGFSHHGFAAVLCAVDSLQTTDRAGEPQGWLECTDGARVSAQLAQLTRERVHAIRSQFVAIGTCSITDPVDDLVTLGLVRSH